MNKNLKGWLIVLIIFSIIIALYVRNSNKNDIKEEVHEHADFKVYVLGEEINFSQGKYMLKNKEVHVEGMEGTVIHKHAGGITLGYFFGTLGIRFNSTCFILDSGEEYCNDDGKTLKFYVNGKENKEFGNYEIRDNEKYLISYGNETEKEIEKQINSM